MADFVFLHAGHMPRCRAEVDKHFQGYVSLQLLARGDVRLCYDSAVHQLQQAAVWTCFPGPRIRFNAMGKGTWDHRYLAFTGPRVVRWKRAGLWREGVLATAVTARVIDAFDAALAAAKEASPHRAAWVANRVEALLLELADATRPAPDAAWIGQAVHEVQSSETPPDMDALAERFDVAVPTLRRHVRQYAGRPLHTLWMAARIDRARRLLRDTDLPIKAVAERLGYCDVYHFSRQFRRIAGVPPGVYRQSRQV